MDKNLSSARGPSPRYTSKILVLSREVIVLVLRNEKALAGNFGVFNIGY